MPILFGCGITAIESHRAEAGVFGRGRLIREIELLADSQVTLLSERRKFQPYGLAGGMPGASGSASLIDGKGAARSSLEVQCSGAKGIGFELRRPAAAVGASRAHPKSDV